MKPTATSVTRAIASSHHRIIASFAGIQNLYSALAGRSCVVYLNNPGDDNLPPTGNWPEVIDGSRGCPLFSLSPLASSSSSFASSSSTTTPATPTPPSSPPASLDNLSGVLATCTARRFIWLPSWTGMMEVVSLRKDHGQQPLHGNGPATSVCPTDSENIAPRLAPPGKIDKRSFEYMFRSGLAGGLAGCAAKTVIAPLDRVKILFQASNPQYAKYTGSWLGVVAAVRDIKRNEGVVGLFRGHSATLLRIFPYAAIKFIAYEQIRTRMITSPEQETTWRRFLSGSLAGVTSVFFTYPLEVVRVRLAFETRKDYPSGLRSICSQIYSEPHSRRSPLSGLSNFYRGFSSTVLGMLPYAGISFLGHDRAGDWLRSEKLAKYTVIDYPEGQKPTLNMWAQLCAGGFAGATGQTLSYPLEVIRRRMQVGGAVGEGRFLGIKETAIEIYKTAGVRGFFVGLTIGYVKVVPMVATSFFVYERLKLYVGIS